MTEADITDRDRAATAFDAWYLKLAGGAYETASNIALAREAFVAGWVDGVVFTLEATAKSKCQNASR